MSTISDVAARAGVSAATVSRVLNGKPQVAEGTRQRVLTAAAELGYSPSRTARALARGRSMSIGVVVPLATGPSTVERLEGLSARLAPSGYDLSLFNVRAESEAADILSQLADPERVGAVVLISMKPSPDQVRALHRAAVPVVVIDSKVPDVDCVYIDDAEGGRMAARALLSAGHRRIAFVGDSENRHFGFTTSETRLAAFEDVLATASLRIGDECLKRGEHGSDYAKEATFELLGLAEPPTAIFAASDSQAIGVLEAAHERGVDVPRDLSVIGFDDIRSARGMGLTTVRQPLEESGAYGAKLVLEAIEHQPMGMAIELPLTLINRSSTGPPPGFAGR